MQRPSTELKSQTTDLQWAAPHSLFQDARCRRPGPFCRSHSRAVFHRARSRGSGPPSARPGDCRVGNWLVPLRKMHPTDGLGCRGYCWLDCERGVRGQTRRRAKRGKGWVFKDWDDGIERESDAHYETWVNKSWEHWMESTCVVFEGIILHLTIKKWLIVGFQHVRTYVTCSGWLHFD